MNLRDELMAKCTTTGTLRNQRKKKLNVVTIQNAADRKAKGSKMRFSTSGSTSFNLRGNNHSRDDNVSETFESFNDTNDSDCKVILAITQGRGEATCEIGIAAINIMRPSLIMCQISDTLSYTNILTKMNILNPSEILIPMTTTSTRLTDKIKEYFKNTKIMGVPRNTFNSHNGFNCVKRVCAFNWNSIVLMVQYKYYALTAVSALLTYIENHLYTFYAAESMKVEYEESEGFMIIDVLTADKLELVACALPDINPKYSSLRGILNNCVTKIGSRTLRATILQPPCCLEEINARLDCVEELVKDQSKLTSLREILTQLSKIDHLLSLASIMPDRASSCSVRQLNYILLLNTVFDVLKPLNDIFVDSTHTFFVELRETLSHKDFSYLKNIVRTVIHENARPAAGEQGMTERCFAIKPGVNPILDIIRKRYSERLDELRDYVRKLGVEHSLDLKLSNNSKKGYHIVLKLSRQEIKSFKLSSLPEVFIHVERTVTMVTMTTIDIQTFQIRLEDISTEIVKISNVILYKLLLEIQKHISIFYKMCEQIAKVDMMQSLALSSSSVDKYVRPKFNCFTEVINGRHPLLEYLADKDPIGNDIFVSPEFNMNIVTGPNSSGKSIYIRQMALLQIMAQIGCFVPASSATFRVADRILARIYLEDDMYCGASAFTLEMKEIKYFFNVMTPNTLIIIDELCRSTSVLEGTGLAMAICEKLLQTPAFIFFTTHYTFITRLYDMYYNVQCWQLETEEIMSGTQKRIVYTHKIVPGVTKLEDYAIYSARTCWPSDVMKDVEAVKKYIDVKQLNALVFRIEPQMRLKYNIEADLKILKYKGLCTKDSVRERMIMYQQDLNKLGMHVDWDNNSQTIRSSESESAPQNLDLSFQQIIQPEVVYSNSTSPQLNENNAFISDEFQYPPPEFSSDEKQVGENLDFNDIQKNQTQYFGTDNQNMLIEQQNIDQVTNFSNVGHQYIDKHTRQIQTFADEYTREHAKHNLVDVHTGQFLDKRARPEFIDEHIGHQFIDEHTGQIFMGEHAKQKFVGKLTGHNFVGEHARQHLVGKQDRQNLLEEHTGQNLLSENARPNFNNVHNRQPFLDEHTEHQFADESNTQQYFQNNVDSEEYIPPQILKQNQQHFQKNIDSEEFLLPQILEQNQKYYGKNIDSEEFLPTQILEQNQYYQKNINSEEFLPPQILEQNHGFIPNLQTMQSYESQENPPLGFHHQHQTFPKTNVPQTLNNAYFYNNDDSASVSHQDLIQRDEIEAGRSHLYAQPEENKISQQSKHNIQDFNPNRQELPSEQNYPRNLQKLPLEKDYTIPTCFTPDVIVNEYGQLSSEDDPDFECGIASRYPRCPDHESQKEFVGYANSSNERILGNAQNTEGEEVIGMEVEVNEWSMDISKNQNNENHVEKNRDFGRHCKNSQGLNTVNENYQNVQQEGNERQGNDLQSKINFGNLRIDNCRSKHTDNFRNIDQNYSMNHGQNFFELNEGSQDVTDDQNYQQNPDDSSRDYQNYPTNPGEIFLDMINKNNYGKHIRDSSQVVRNYQNYQQSLGERSQDDTDNQNCRKDHEQQIFQLNDSSQYFEDPNNKFKKTKTHYQEINAEQRINQQNNKLLDSNQRKSFGGNQSTIENSSFTTINEFQFAMPLRKNIDKTSTPLVAMNKTTPKFTSVAKKIGKQSTLDSNTLEKQSSFDSRTFEKESTIDSISEAELNETMEYLENSGYFFEDEFPENPKKRKCDQGDSLNESISYSPDYELMSRYKENQKEIPEAIESLNVSASNYDERNDVLRMRKKINNMERSASIAVKRYSSNIDDLAKSKSNVIDRNSSKLKVIEGNSSKIINDLETPKLNLINNSFQKPNLSLIENPTINSTFLETSFKKSKITSIKTQQLNNISSFRECETNLNSKSKSSEASNAASESKSSEALDGKSSEAPNSSKSKKSTSMLNNINSSSHSRSIPNVTSNLGSTVSVSKSSKDDSCQKSSGSSLRLCTENSIEKNGSSDEKSYQNSRRESTRLRELHVNLRSENISSSNDKKDFENLRSENLISYDKESKSENLRSSSNQNSSSENIIRSSDDRLKFTSDEKERSFIQNLKSFEDINKSKSHDESSKRLQFYATSEMNLNQSRSHIFSSSDERLKCASDESKKCADRNKSISHDLSSKIQFHSTSEINLNQSRLDEDQRRLNESIKSSKLYENSNESMRSSIRSRKPINKMTKKEIEQLYHERDLKFINSTGDQCFKYSEEILNRPKAKQLKASKQVAVARKGDDGSVVVICDQNPTKQKRIARVNQPLRHNVGRKFDVTIFSDQNSHVFDEFMQTEEDPKKDRVFFDKVFHRENEASASSFVSANMGCDIFTRPTTVFKFAEGDNSIDEIVKKYS